jgi:hypothetical protein
MTAPTACARIGVVDVTAGTPKDRKDHDMVITVLRGKVVQLALALLICAGVAGGMVATAPSASAKPMSCAQVLAAGDDANAAAWRMLGLGLNGFAQVYANRAERYYSYYDANC